MDKIIELEINNFEKCNNIWNMDKNIDHKNKIYNDLVSGNRKTFVYVKDNEYIAEASLVLIKLMKIILFLMFEYIFLELL